MEIKVPGVKVYRSRGKVYIYHRKTGKRIKSAPGLAAFLAETERLTAASASQAPKPGTVGALIEAYRKSPEFSDLAERTRSDYQKVFDYLKPIDGDLLADLAAPFILEVRDAAFAKHKRRFANYVVAVLRLLLKWGAVRDLLPTNPAAEVPKIRRPRGAPIANRAWDEDECAAVLSGATGGLKVGIALGMFAGMREGDAIRAARSVYDGISLRWVQGKTGTPIELPVDQRLKVILDTTLAGKKEARIEAMTLVVGERGKPYTLDGFRTMFFRLIRELENGLARCAPASPFMAFVIPRAAPWRSATPSLA